MLRIVQRVGVLRRSIATSRTQHAGEQKSQKQFSEGGDKFNFILSGIAVGSALYMGSKLTGLSHHHEEVLIEKAKAYHTLTELITSDDSSAAPITLESTPTEYIEQETTDLSETLNLEITEHVEQSDVPQNTDTIETSTNEPTVTDEAGLVPLESQTKSTESTEPSSKQPVDATTTESGIQVDSDESTNSESKLEDTTVLQTSETPIKTDQDHQNDPDSNQGTTEPVGESVEGEDVEKDAVPAKDPVIVDPHALPEHVPYLIIGGGPAAFSAMRSITNKDPGTKVLIVTDEGYPPYQRPPLSKEVWFDTSLAASTLTYKAWSNKPRSLFMDSTWDFAEPGELLHYEGTKVGLATGCRVSHLDPLSSTAHLSDGRTITYDKCLVAIGGEPKKLPEVESIDKSKITYYRKLDDFLKLNNQCQSEFKGKTIAVVGGGFLGSELAVALGHQGKIHDFSVSQVIKEPGNMGFILPDYLATWTTEKVKKCNVDVIPNSRIQSAKETPDGKVRLGLSSGKSISVDHVVVAVGIETDQEFAEKSGLEWDEKLGAIVVNSELQARSNIWVAGDAMSFYDQKLGRRKIEHQNHAVVSGRLAGGNMTGGVQTSYWHQSFFWSDLGPDIGFEAIGLIDSKQLRTVGFFAKATNKDTPSERENISDNVTSAVAEEESKDYGKGVIFYMNKKDIVVGMICWNVFGKMSVGRKVIAEQMKGTPETLEDLAKLFKINPTPKSKKAKNSEKKVKSEKDVKSDKTVKPAVE